MSLRLAASGSDSKTRMGSTWADALVSVSPIPKGDLTGCSPSHFPDFLARNQTSPSCAIACWRRESIGELSEKSGECANLFSWLHADGVDSVDQSFPCDSVHLPDKNGDTQYRYSGKSSNTASLDRVRTSQTCKMQALQPATQHSARPDSRERARNNQKPRRTESASTASRLTSLKNADD
jgi:hypothetical protein